MVVTVHDHETDEWVLHKGSTSPELEPSGSLHSSLMGGGSKLMHKRSVRDIIIGEDGGGEDVDPSTVEKRLCLLVIIAALISSAISFGVDKAVLYTTHMRVLAVEQSLDYMPGIVAEALITMLLLTGARLVVLWHPPAAGSGIPEVKCLLSGRVLAGFATKGVCFAKAVGLVMSIAGGLPVGKEGPFVHIAVCVTKSAWRDQFWLLFKISHVREVALLAAVAVGSGATFSAPVGGLLFAVELMMPCMYEPKTYKMCFLASTMGSLVYLSLKTISSSGGIKPLFFTDVKSVETKDFTADMLLLVISMGLGALCGVLGALFVKCYKMWAGVIKWCRGDPKKSRFLNKVWKRDLVILAVVSVLTALKKTMSPLFQIGPAPLVSKLFSTEFTDDYGADLGYSIGGLFIVYLLHVTLSISLPIPNGCVAPLVALGALAGRFYGLCLPDSLQNVIEDGTGGAYGDFATRLAIVGATCLTASVCQTMSIVVMVFEIVAVPGLILPLSLATIVAMWVGRQLGPSIFDCILMIKQLPGLPTLTASHHAMDKVTSAMHRDIKHYALPLDASLEDVDRVIALVEDEGNKKHSQHVPKSIPIVKVVGEKLLLCGAVNTQFADHDEDNAEGKDGLQTLRNQMSSQMKSKPLDIAAIAVNCNVMVTPMQIQPNMTIKDVYLQAQLKHYNKTMMVIDHDHTLLGMLTQGDLLLRCDPP